jgi:hypothetical protein
MRNLIQEKKGVAGLNVYLSLIAMLFMIGIVVMVFQIAGVRLSEEVKFTNETGTYDTDASTTIDEVRESIGSATGWFGTFIVLGAMVVLILLVVIIINSIRATGLISEGA